MKNNYSKNELMEKISAYMNKQDIELVKKAYEFSKKAHLGQRRQDGEDYFIHPENVAIILAEKFMDAPTICAGLLHDILEDTKYSPQELGKLFGTEVKELVEGVTKTEKIRFRRHEDYNAENLKKILFATAKDVRIMILKLADRLHNMRTLNTLRPDKQKRIAQETLEIFAPLAHKLGMWVIKGELEDLALRYTKPEIYFMLKNKINEKRGQREEYTKNIIKTIEKKIKENNIKAKVYGRAKYFYSIYQKMLKKGKKLEDIHDLIALRIICDDKNSLYKILDIIHELYTPIKGRLKDYVTNPKQNEYQSIHTDVMTKENKILEFQLRTNEMHHNAEEGIAAHWRYKNINKDKKFDKKLSWLKQILDWKKEFSGQEFVDSLKIDLFKNEIIILTPKGDTIILPEGATPIDFAYTIHTNVGNSCSKAKVNGNIVTLDYVLKSGDTVEIITSKNSIPKRSWLNFAKTSKAKSKIRNKLNIKIEKDIKFDKNEKDFEENLIHHLDIDNKKNIKISKCCNPQFNDDICCFKTKAGTITIHKQDCPNIVLFNKEKAIPIKWKKEDKTIRNIQISVKDRIGLIDEILDLSLQNRLKIMNINIKTTKHKNVLVLIKVKSDDNIAFKKTLEAYSKIDNVFSAKEELKA